jgi:uncharacterized protein YkwD
MPTPSPTPARLLAVAVLALLASLLAPAPAPAVLAREAQQQEPRVAVRVAASDLAAARARIRKRTNAYRVAQGLPRLATRKDLHRVSQRWSRKMAAAGQMTHNPSYAAQIPSGWTAAGENVAAGYPVGKVTPAWWHSPGHRANMLGDYTHIGIGYAVSANGTPYYTQNFARY